MQISLTVLSVSILITLIGCGYSSAVQEGYWELPISSRYELVAKSVVSLDTENTTDGNGSLSLESQGFTRVELYKLTDIDVGNTRVTYKAKMRVQNLISGHNNKGIAYIEMVVRFADGEELIARGPRVPLTGTTDWKSVDTLLYIDKGMNPESINLNMVVDGKGRVWIDDIVLHTHPLRLDYLFWGHSVVWIVLLIYIYDLLRKNRKLNKELDLLK